MPSRRELIEMTPDEIAAYLLEQKRMIVVSNGPHGLPHPMPMNYGLDETGRVLMTTFAKSQKVKNLERDPRASLLVESGMRYDEMKAVILYCDAEIVREPDAVRALMLQITADVALTSAKSVEMDDQIRASIAKRVVIRFTPFRTISWDHGKLGGAY
ncbi:MAG: pyridoxamine 5'-phosphate oxidase family protein [Novosphingobium sp.]|nr:pyridoxamine 5'-phosphate oxidase family protein [Novosphingobium sp.]